MNATIPYVSIVACFISMGIIMLTLANVIIFYFTTQTKKKKVFTHIICQLAGFISVALFIAFRSNLIL